MTAATAHRTAPDKSPPPNLRVRINPGVLLLEDGQLLLGGTPSRLVRVKPAGARAIACWRAGGPVGEDESVRTLARRLLDAGILAPDPTPAATQGLNVVVPVHGRAEQLARCLEAIRRSAPDAALLVVDDGSPDADTIAAIAVQHRAALIRHPVRRGPSAARNTGIAHSDRPLVAFVDSDVVIEPGCLARLAGHFDDPATGAAAPRVLALDRPQGAVATYEAHHSSLDMGPRPGRVHPWSPVPYIPSATLVVRRDAVGPGFDEALHIGEDVDLVWRIGEAGWGVWYDPSVAVRHEHRSSIRAFAARRFTYATSIAALAARHPHALTALRVDAATWIVLAALMRRPRIAGCLAAALVIRTRATLRDRTANPTRLAAELSARSVLRAGRSLAYALRRPWWPVCAVPALRRHRIALILGGAWAVTVIENKPACPSDAALAIADDVIAAVGTWCSCLRHRSMAPLLPTLRDKASQRGGRGAQKQRASVRHPSACLACEGRRRP